MSEDKPVNRSAGKRAGRKKDGESDTQYIEYKHKSDAFLNKITEVDHLSEKEKLVIKLVVVNKYKYKDAGVRAGYSPSTSGSYVSKIINTLGGKKYVDYLYQLQFEAEDELVLKWKKEMNMLAFTDRTAIIQKITNQNLTTIPLDEWPEDVRACVKGMKKSPTGAVEIIFESKVPALDALGKHLGIYLKDNMQKPENEQSVVFYIPDNNREIKEKT